jgi:hypothetical protein
MAGTSSAFSALSASSPAGANMPSEHAAAPHALEAGLGHGGGNGGEDISSLLEHQSMAEGGEAGGGGDEEEDDDDDASPLLGPLLGDLSDLFREEVLKKWLDPTDLALFARSSRDCLAAVVASGLPRAGLKGGEFPLDVRDFVTGSIELLAWAKTNGCPWDTEILCTRR